MTHEEFVAVLSAHRWDDTAKGCSCGWTQLRTVGRRDAQLNHPHHVAAVLLGAQEAAS